MGVMTIYITVLYGGCSAERAVSMLSGERILKALLSAGHSVEGFDYRGALDVPLRTRLQKSDAVFLALHGGAEEGGGLQAALDAAGIRHYTGSDSKGASLAMNKQEAKRSIKETGVAITADALWKPRTAPPLFPLPCIVKPLCGGSSIGFHIARERDEITALAPVLPMLIEPLLTGREYTVGILAGQPLPVVEIRPQGGVYDYTRKYTAGETAELCPAPIPAEKADLLQKWALLAFRALGLRDYARIDFKENAEGVPHFLEANTLPGMTETSLFPLAAATAGITFPALCTQMAMLAAERKNP